MGILDGETEREYVEHPLEIIHIFKQSRIFYAASRWKIQYFLALGMPVISPSLVLISVLLGVGMTVLAGLLPAWNASRITPLEALRPTQAEVEFKRQTGIGFFIGVALLVLTAIAILSGQPVLILPGGILFLVGLVLVAPALVRPFVSLFGRLVELATIRAGIGNLAQSNLTRQPFRVAVTASASMLGPAVIVAAGALISSMFGMVFGMVKDSLGSDYLFIPPSVGLWNDNVGASPAFAASLRGIDGVEMVNTQRFATSSVRGSFFETYSNLTLSRLSLKYKYTLQVVLN